MKLPFAHRGMINAGEIFAGTLIDLVTKPELLKKAKAEGLRPEIYCHPMGTYVYRYGLKGGVLSKRSEDYGPNIGSEGYFDEQGNQLPTRSGERVLNTNTAYAMELDITHSVPEWRGQDIRIVLEEKVVFTKDGLIFPGGRQERYHIIH